MSFLERFLEILPLAELCLQKPVPAPKSTMTSLSGDLEKGKMFSMLYIVLPGVYVTRQAVEAGAVERKGHNISSLPVN